MNSCPFVAKGKIEALELFIGRRDELEFITRRMIGAQPISVNIHGERQIGKSSLLWHFYRTWEQRVEPSLIPHYALIFLSLRDARCSHEADFYKLAADLLCACLPTDGDSAAEWENGQTWTRQTFADAMNRTKNLGVLPVLCLDGVEGAFRDESAFDSGFYDNLRALMDANALMLIVASNEPLAGHPGLGSLFLNLSQGKELHAFSTELDFGQN